MVNVDWSLLCSVIAMAFILEALPSFCSFVPRCIPVVPSFELVP